MSLEALSQNDCDSEMSQSKGLQPEENSAQSKLLRDNIFEVKLAIYDLLYWVNQVIIPGDSKKLHELDCT